MDFVTRGLRKAFDLDRRRSASPRERQASSRERSDFVAEGLKKAFDLDRRRSASPQASPRERPHHHRQEEFRRAPSPRPSRQQSRVSRSDSRSYQQAPGRGTSRVSAFHEPRGQSSRAPGRYDSRAAELTQRGLPVDTPSGPSRRERDA